MADSSDPTSTGTITRFVLSASVDATGALQITGPELRDNTLAAPLGTEVVVKIEDAAGLHVYGVEIVGGGERGNCWSRVADKGLTKRKFTVGPDAINNIVYAVASADTAKIKYGPVITVKPKG